MTYIKENFLLTNKTAEKLYFGYAKDMPIFDYHCHLPEKEILDNKQFTDIFEIWLKGDHYKWRLMRNYGVNEEYITGNKSNKEKFIAYCETLSTAFGNPLYHWSQVELKEFFNCELEINKENAEQIWDWCNEYIKVNQITPQKLIEQSNVEYIFTTNEVFDNLQTFLDISKKGYNFKVIPAFRADKIMNIEAEKYNDFVSRLGDITSLDFLEKALEERLKAFIEVGTVASDIALQSVYEVSTREDAEKVFIKRRKGDIVSEKESQIFKGYLTYFLMKLYAKYDIRCELHLGAMRNNNTEMLKRLGLDTGYDSIAEDNSIRLLSRLMDRLNDENSLPKTIIFNLNPKMNSEIMTLIGCFQDDSTKGKLQYGPAWWFLDNKVGMEKHLEDLTATGHIAAFVGMLTDSRSFLSYPRHHYFRRILCNYLGKLMENGEITNDIELVGKVVKDVSFNNSISYFGVKEGV
ncbi:MAG: glucuronate isomerase [Clostridiales bacterium]|nr:glucuronate isomerase [Clostridiales bacterium]